MHLVVHQLLHPRFQLNTQGEDDASSLGSDGPPLKTFLFDPAAQMLLRSGFVSLTHILKPQSCCQGHIYIYMVPFLEGVRCGQRGGRGPAEGVCRAYHQSTLACGKDPRLSDPLIRWSLGPGLLEDTSRPKHFSGLLGYSATSRSQDLP